MILHIHDVIDSCQNRVSVDQYHMTLWRAHGFAPGYVLFFFHAHSTRNKLCFNMKQRPDFGRKKSAFFSGTEGSYY